MENWENNYKHLNVLHTLEAFKKNYTGKPIKAIITGGGFSFANILMYPGASKIIDKIDIPYSVDSIYDYNTEFKNISKLCSEEALSLYEKTIDPSGLNQDYSYVCVTSALSSDRERKGYNVSFISVNKKRYKINFSKIDWNGSDNSAKNEFRKTQDNIIGVFVLAALTGNFSIYLSSDFINYFEELNDHLEICNNIVSNRRGYFICKNDIFLLDCEKIISDCAIYPGSFNPYHDAHNHIYNSMPIFDKYIEISKNIQFKGSITASDLKNRLSSIGENKSVIVSTESKFFDKMAMFPNSTFYVGSDTFKRIIDMDSKEMLESITDKYNCRLIVFKRNMPEVENSVKEYKNCTLYDNDLPESIRNLSSTKIREGLI